MAMQMENQLATHNREDGRLPFPSYRQPREVGFFSLDSKRNVYMDKSQLRSYSAPAKTRGLGIDLNEGFEQFVWRDEDKCRDEKIDPILKWILANRRAFNHFDQCGRGCKDLHTDFITWRGIFTRVMCAPFEGPSSDGWRFVASRFRGTIYICEEETVLARQRRQTQTEEQKRFMYWGYKLEDVLTTACQGEEQRAAEAMNNTAGFCTVARCRLNEYSFVVSGEVDCRVEGVEEASPANYAEMKTHRILQTNGQDRSFKKWKMMKTWAQCFLPGVPNVIIGFRNDDGVLHELKSYKTMEIPMMVKGLQGLWDPCVCVNFLNRFLSWLKKVVVKDDPRVTYVLQYDGPFNVITVKEHLPGSDHEFLPMWFTHPQPPVQQTV